MEEKNKAAEEKSAAAGLKINTKTIIGVCIILAVIMVLAGVVTQLVPRGEYQLDEAGQIIDGTYQTVDFKLPIWKIVLSPILIFTSSYISTGLGIVLFIVLLGGTFLILDDRGVMKYIMATIIKKFRDKKYVLLCAVIFVFMALSSIAGILEESVTLVPITVAIALALGWDSMVGIIMSLGAVAFGFAAATFNPFNVVTVQKLAGIEVFSGLSMRVFMFICSYIVLAGFTVLYAKKIEKNPLKSVSHETDKEQRERYKLDNMDEILSDASISKATKTFILFLCLALICVAADFILSATGLLATSGLVSMGGMALMFTLGGLVAGHIAGLDGKGLWKKFSQGIKTIAPALPLIWFIICITYILQEGKIIHTILYQIYNIIQDMSPYSAVLLIFAFVALLEFFIGSGTAKAFLIMPIVAPLATLIGISGNNLVLTYCMADGFTNLLYPTSGLIIIAIGLVNVSYGKWLKFSWKLFAAQFIVSVFLMHLAIKIGYGF